MNESLNCNDIKQQLRIFAKKRNWEKYHNPKNLAMALSVEAAELVEIFQWMSDAESNEVVNDSQITQSIAHELADIMLYSLRVADVLNINIVEAIHEKIELNKQKYPVD